MSKSNGLVRMRLREKKFWQRRLAHINLKNGIQILPHLFTLGNGFFGFASIAFSSQGEFVAAAYCILLGALMDMLDGRIARLANVTSDLGVQLDSLCDAITFCCAPAFLIYKWQLRFFGGLGLGIAAIFMLAGLLRLARFNITQALQTVAFIGMPTPIAGCFIVSLLLNLANYQITVSSIFITIIITLFLSFFMISKIRFPTLKQISGKTYKQLFLIGGGLVVVLGHNFLILTIFVAYFIYTALYSVFLKNESSKISP